ncbi:MAG: signal recognition particle-docking protein FtsY [Fimbriimonadaceae bacterium]|nr:signal recognition particle-docking protein FtsY [Fimbriimonadaceae bacterium]
MGPTTSNWSEDTGPVFRKVMERLDRVLGRGVIDENLYSVLEEELLLADTSVAVTEEILSELRDAVRKDKVTTVDGIRERLRHEIASRFDWDRVKGLNEPAVPPALWLFVGVNGVGKTTTIGKLASSLKSKGKRPLLAAGDTFRAAAIEQLQVWAERSGADFVGASPGSDSASVVFSAIEAAKARGCTHVLADTAGRQHTKSALMTELGKTVRVAEKAMGRAPDEVLLVLDANTGQNAVRQAEEFGHIAGVTGLVLTKVDGTAKGGALIGLQRGLHLPVKLVGTGEGIEDLRLFDPKWFAERLFA